MVPKRFYIRQVLKLGDEIKSLKKQLPLKSFEIKTSDGEFVEVKGHGINYRNDHNTVAVWIHPWDDVAIFINPIYAKEKI